LSQKQTTHNPGHANGHSNKHQNEEEAGTVFPHSQGRLGVSHNPFSKATKAEIQQNPRDFQPPKKKREKSEGESEIPKHHNRSCHQDEEHTICVIKELAGPRRDEEEAAAATTALPQRKREDKKRAAAKWKPLCSLEVLAAAAALLQLTRGMPFR
jgi:hypothetical protein